MSHGLPGHSVEDGLSTAMRLLIHYAGDVHQPLHATSRVDKEYPEGDRGGNDFPLPSKEGAKNLHAVWDSVIYEFTGYGQLPFTADDWTKNGADAQKLVAAHPIGDEGKDLNVLDWANQSFQIAEDFVYAHIKEGDALPDDYLDQAKTYAEKQIVLGGTRLANLLMSLKLESAVPSEQETSFLQ